MSTTHTTFAFPTTPSVLEALLEDMQKQRDATIQSAEENGDMRRLAYLNGESARQFYDNRVHRVLDMLAIPPAERLEDQLWFWIPARVGEDHSDLAALGMSDEDLRDCIAREDRLTWRMIEVLMHLLCDRVQEAFDGAARFGEAGTPVPDSFDFSTPMWADVEIKASPPA
jgi:hypothetical protein